MDEKPPSICSDYACDNTVDLNIDPYAAPEVIMQYIDPNRLFMGNIVLVCTQCYTTYLHLALKEW